MGVLPTSVNICAICGSLFSARGSVCSVRSVGISVLPQISRIYTDVRVLSRGCTCLKCTNRAIGAFCFVGAVLALASDKAERRQLPPGLAAWVWQECHTLLICAHPYHLWEALLCKRFCVFGAFRGSFFTACSVGAAETAAPPCRNLLQHFEPSLLQVCPELWV